MKLAIREARFAILCRVSTREQEERGHSLQVQQDLCRQYVEKAGGKVAQVYSGQESATTEDRKVLPHVLADAGRKYTDLVFEDLTRLSRNPATMFDAMGQLTKAGCRLHDIRGPLDTATPEGEFHVMINSVVGRFTARQGVKKSINARLAILRGGGIAAGRPPWGRTWDKKRKVAELIPECVKQIRSAYDLLVVRRMSLAQTAERLSIGSSSLRKAITQAAWTKFTQELQGERFEFKCPALLNPFEQQRMVRRLAENRIMRPHVKGAYLLQGLVKCSCNAHMTGQTSIKGKYRYQVYRHPPGTYRDGCTWQIPVALLDEDVLTACAEVVKSGGALRDAIKAELQLRYGNALPKLAQRRDELRKAIKKDEATLDGCVDILAKLVKSSESKERTHQRIERTEDALKADRAELKRVEAEMADLDMPRPDADEIAAKLRSLYWASGAGPKVMLKLEQKRAFIRNIIGIAPELGVFVQMHRHPGGSKKAVYWRYKLKGLVASAANYLDPAGEPSYPEVAEITVPRGAAIQHLAAIAGTSKGVRFGATRTRSSSGA